MHWQIGFPDEYLEKFEGNIKIVIHIHTSAALQLSL